MAKETLIFIISQVGGEIAIKVEYAYGEITVLWRGNPLELTADILNNINCQLILSVMIM